MLTSGSRFTRKLLTTISKFYENILRLDVTLWTARQLRRCDLFCFWFSKSKSFMCLKFPIKIAFHSFLIVSFAPGSLPSLSLLPLPILTPLVSWHCSDICLAEHKTTNMFNLSGFLQCYSIKLAISKGFRRSVYNSSDTREVRQWLPKLAKLDQVLISEQRKTSFS